jgi:hypothetical protein
VLQSSRFFLDADGLGKVPHRDQKAIDLVLKKNFRLVWQHPCHEAFLLRHFRQTVKLRPPSTAEAIKQLEKIWPNYRKGMDAFGYESVLTIDHVATARRELPEFNKLLAAIGWPE